MASVSINQMRDLVRNAYKGEEWRAKVDRMPDNQVIRLYYSFNERGTFNKKPTKARREKRKDRCEQLSFDDM